MTTLWYFPIEPLKSRYTEQLCNLWMPKAFSTIAIKDAGFQMIRLDGEITGDDIKVGSVLDATGRGIYSLTQVSKFLKYISSGAVKNGDILYLQDFWTPGIEAIFYAMHLMSLDLKIYSMCHAQSVDIYDFTYPMREWIRPIEIAYANQHTGIFVASTIHRELLKVAGVTAPIHVVSLPIDYNEVRSHIEDSQKRNIVTFVSRLDAEKQPDFMLEVAIKFLEQHPSWVWYISTSKKEFTSTVPGFIERMYKASQHYSNLFLICNQSKESYYSLLSSSKINFNSSLQDFVSWTLLEACTAGCDLVYPNYRSFAECIPQERLYKAFDIDSALRLFNEVIRDPWRRYSIAILANQGRLKEADIILNGIDHEYNLYEEHNNDDHTQ